MASLPGTGPRSWEERHRNLKHKQTNKLDAQESSKLTSKLCFWTRWGSLDPIHFPCSHTAAAGKAFYKCSGTQFVSELWYQKKRLLPSLPQYFPELKSPKKKTFEKLWNCMHAKNSMCSSWYPCKGCFGSRKQYGMESRRNSSHRNLKMNWASEDFQNAISHSCCVTAQKVSKIQGTSVHTPQETSFNLHMIGSSRFAHITSFSHIWMVSSLS